MLCQFVGIYCFIVGHCACLLGLGILMLCWFVGRFFFVGVYGFIVGHCACLLGLGFLMLCWFVGKGFFVGCCASLLLLEFILHCAGG